MTYLHSSSNSYYFVQESRAAKLEYAKIHGRIWVFFDTFLTRHARRDSDEFHNDSRSLAISLALLRTEGIGNGGSERTIAISTFTFLFSESEEKKPGRQKISCVCDWPCRGYWDLYSSGMTIPSDLPSEIHLQKFADKEEFQSWIVNFHVEVCAKAKNLALVLQWIKRPKQPARWRTPPIQNQLQEKISLKTKSWIWWWRQNWHGASIFLIWSRKLASVEPWQDK